MTTCLSASTLAQASTGFSISPHSPQDYGSTALSSLWQCLLWPEFSNMEVFRALCWPRLEKSWRTPKGLNWESARNPKNHKTNFPWVLVARWFQRGLLAYGPDQNRLLRKVNDYIHFNSLLLQQEEQGGPGLTEWGHQRNKNQLKMYHVPTLRQT